MKPSNYQRRCVVCGEDKPLTEFRRHADPWCSSCYSPKRAPQKGHGYRRHKKDACERCGFVPEHPIQLEAHHIDRDRKNNAPENLRTLCANCHRLEHVRHVATV